MIVKSLNMPDRFPEMGAWLDDCLVSPEVTSTIVQLEVLAGDRVSDLQTLDGILADERSTVMQGGLAQADESTVRAFLRQPALLLELQEQVMMHGGEYWQRKTDAAFSGRRGTQVVSTATKTKVNKELRNSSNYSKTLTGAIVALAAAVLIAIAIPQFFGSDKSVASTEWGFAESGLLTSSISEPEMLTQLAEASASWHRKVPATPEQLEKRLREFDIGCQSLLESNLSQLSAINRDKVHAACEVCRGAIATQLAALKDGANFDSVLSDSNTAIDQLTNAITTLS